MAELGQLSASSSYFGSNADVTHRSSNPSTTWNSMAIRRDPSMGSIDDNAARTYPLKRPRGHKVPVPRWSLRFTDPSVMHLYTMYIGVQCHSRRHELRGQAESVIDSILANSALKTPVIDTFRVTHGFDIVHSKVWVAYWKDAPGYEAALAELNLVRLWNRLGEDKHDIGLWVEHFVAPLERLETNYARLDHKPGLAQLDGTEQPSHELTAYWGAGRDRIPASAHDLFPAPEDIKTPVEVPKGFGQRLTGSNYDNMCHIRSGQWWELCGDEERIAYETDLQGTLMEGMNYLWGHPEETGTIGLRFLQNLDQKGHPMKETCGAGFYRNWSDLEKWSSRHSSHLAIFNGMMAHAKRFGDARKLMTWHEVWIFKAGEAKFDYVNSSPETGVIKWVEMGSQPLAKQTTFQASC